MYGRSRNRRPGPIVRRRVHPGAVLGGVERGGRHDRAVSGVLRADAPAGFGSRPVAVPVVGWIPRPRVAYLLRPPGPGESGRPAPRTGGGLVISG